MAVLLVAVVGTAAAYLGIRLNNTVSSIERDSSALPTGSRPPSASASVKANYAPMNILLIGSDTRKGERGLSDTFIVMHFSADRKSVYLVSFPRDMYVSIPGYGKDKINAAYSYGGTSLSVETIEKLLGARIDHTVVTNFENFVALVNTVGPITVDNPVASSPIRPDSRGVKYPEFGKTGPVTLKDGYMALAFVRERENLFNGDLDRTLRQRAFLKALALKVVTPEVLANPIKLNEVISTVSNYVTVDALLTNEAIFSLALSMTGITSSDQIHMVMAPIDHFETLTGIGAVDIIDAAGVAALGKALQTDTMPQFVAKYPSSEYGYTPPSTSPLASASTSASPSKATSSKATATSTATKKKT